MRIFRLKYNRTNEKLSDTKEESKNSLKEKREEEQNSNEQESTEQQGENTEQENNNEEQKGETQESSSEGQNGSEQKSVEQQGENIEQENNNNNNEEPKGEAQESSSEGQNGSEQKSAEQQGESTEQQNNNNNEEPKGEAQESSSEGQNSSEQESTKKQVENTEKENDNKEQKGEGQNGNEQENTKQQGEREEKKQNSLQEQNETENQTDSKKQEEQQLEDKKENEENSGENVDVKRDNSKEEQQYDAKKAFREMLKCKPKNENISTGSGIELANFDNIKDGEIPESVMNVLIEKFLNKTFVNESDLNAKRESLTPTVGDIKWNIPDLIRHKATKQYNDMLHDKYGFTQENGKDEKIPLAFYFDLSGSMNEYSRMLALMALKLLKKDVKVLIGENEYLQYKINSLPVNTTIEDLVKIFESYSIRYNIKQKNKEQIEEFSRTRIDEYLIEKKAKKVAVFSDFDPKEEIENLSKNCEVYWFCTEERSYYKNSSLKSFKGHFYSMHNIKEFFNHLKNVNNRYYENIQRTKWEGEER